MQFRRGRLRQKSASSRVSSRTAHSNKSLASPQTLTSLKESPKDAQRADPEFVALLAETQNACLEELGYSSTLLAEFQEIKRQRAELQNQCNLLRADNTKLYADNRSLATFIQQQDQRMKLLQDPNDQQKRTITDLHESVRRLTNERDEFAGRLHAAYVFALSFEISRTAHRGGSRIRLNEVVVLRQELARFVPNAVMVSPRERMQSNGVPAPLHAQTVPSQHPMHPSMLAGHGALGPF